MRRPFLPPLLLLALCACASGRTDWVAYYHDHVKKFREENAALDPDLRHLVLVGDSLTEGWTYRDRVRKFLPTLAPRTLVRGISSDGVGVANDRGVLHRMDESIFDCQPSHVALCIGVNDIGADGRGVARAATGLERIARQTRERLPEVPLFLITLAPTRGRAAAYNPHIVTFNERARAIAEATGCRLIDLHALVRDERGELPEAAATRDGLHWSDPVYEVLGRELERAVLEASRGRRRR